ncbi:unnamed protein product [Hermetia illucens]|uniref:Uncharacterized protein n=1 Tax=Hermetia illucens TaxID=343691 RepID=A0A7R8YWW5_HERIL|nr:unnamed protein product [Hermetia illucens]
MGLISPLVNAEPLAFEYISTTIKRWEASNLQARHTQFPIVPAEAYYNVRSEKNSTQFTVEVHNVEKRDEQKRWVIILPAKGPSLQKGYIKFRKSNHPKKRKLEVEEEETIQVASQMKGTELEEFNRKLKEQNPKLEAFIMKLEARMTNKLLKQQAAMIIP